MRRIKVFAVFIALLLVLTSCSFLPDSTGDSKVTPRSGDEGDIANAKFEEVLMAIENKDGTMLKSLFSEKALAEAEDIDVGADYLFDLVQGDIVSWEREAVTAGKSVRSGKVKRDIESWFVLTTTEGTYLFFILYYDEDTIDPSNQGVYALRGIRQEDEATQYAPWNEMEIPGIYIPPEPLPSTEGLSD